MAPRGRAADSINSRREVIHGREPMMIRTYRKRDIPVISRLYYDTIHRVNCTDYTREQLEAWAPSIPSDDFWRNRFNRYVVYVAEQASQIVGFTEWETTGHIDCFFVHHEWQRRGVGTSLMKRVETSAGRRRIRRLFAEVSLTAKPFFLGRGFRIVRQKAAVRDGVALDQYVMEKWLGG